MSGAQVATQYHTSLSASEDFWTAVDALFFSPHNSHFLSVKPGFILTSVAVGDSLLSLQNVRCDQGK